MITHSLEIAVPGKITIQAIAEFKSVNYNLFLSNLDERPGIRDTTQNKYTWNLIPLVTLGLTLAAAAKSLQLCLTVWPHRWQPTRLPPSLGFSRQEHWSGLPFPSPMRESEKGKWSLSVVSDSSQPHGLQPTRLLCPWDFPGKSTGVGCHCFLQGLTLSAL